MAIAAIGSFILFVLSARALLYITAWYPLLIAQTWFVYNQLLLTFSFCEVITGTLAAGFSYSRRSYRWSTAFGIMSTLLGGGIWAITIIVPGYPIWQVMLYFFLPHFLPPLIGTTLLLPRRQEFKR